MQEKTLLAKEHADVSCLCMSITVSFLHVVALPYPIVCRLPLDLLFVFAGGWIALYDVDMT